MIVSEDPTMTDQQIININVFKLKNISIIESNGYNYEADGCMCHDCEYFCARNKRER